MTEMPDRLASVWQQGRSFRHPSTYAAIWVAILLGAPALWAAGVPFSAGHTVDGDFDGAISVVAADVDGDGDLDLIAGAWVANDVSWWENTAGDASAWAEHTVDDYFDGAKAVGAADFDDDGDLDVLGAAEDADDITWWENTAAPFGNPAIWRCSRTRGSAAPLFNG